MQVSSYAILTLATLATTSNGSQQAIASPTTPIVPEKAGLLVVPVTRENTPAPSGQIASPESIIVQQFSQTPANVQSVTNNSTVVTTEEFKETQTDKGTKEVVLPPSSPLPLLPSHPPFLLCRMRKI